MIFGSHSTFEAAGLADNHEALRPSLQNYKINKAGLWVTPSFDFLPCCFLRLHYMPFPGQYKDFRKPSVTRSLERQCRMVSQSILALFFGFMQLTLSDRDRGHTDHPILQSSQHGL